MPKATACAGSCRHLRVSRASPTLHAYSTSTHIRASPTLHPSLSTTTTSLSLSRARARSRSLSLSLSHTQTHTHTHTKGDYRGWRQGGRAWLEQGGRAREATEVQPIHLGETQLACLSSLRTDLRSEFPTLPASILCCLPSFSNTPPYSMHILLPSIYACNKEACCRRILLPPSIMSFGGCKAIHELRCMHHTLLSCFTTIY